MVQGRQKSLSGPIQPRISKSGKRHAEFAVDLERACADLRLGGQRHEVQVRRRFGTHGHSGKKERGEHKQEYPFLEMYLVHGDGLRKYPYEVPQLNRYNSEQIRVAHSNGVAQQFFQPPFTSGVQIRAGSRI
jgi:hypothetical protein